MFIDYFRVNKVVLSGWMVSVAGGGGGGGERRIGRIEILLYHPCHGESGRAKIGVINHIYIFPTLNGKMNIK